LEKLKSFDEILVPDIRSTCWISINEKTGEQKPIDLRKHYDSVQRYQLHSQVPEEIKTHFATSLNLLLYTWYVFRFYKVAELHALTTLEFALRERIGTQGLAEIKAQKKSKGLHSYITYAVEKKWISNEDFSAYHRAPRLKAEAERAFENIMKMEENNLDFLIDDEEIVVPEENDFNFLETLKDSPNKVRNDIAHGSNSLTQEAWITFEYCAEFINKIFAGAGGRSCHETNMTLAGGVGPTQVSETIEKSAVFTP
jgi:hypothetical protein